MKKLILVFAAACLLAPAVHAQTAATSCPVTVSGRAGAEVDWKVMKGLHLNAGYELRSRDSFDGIERHQLTLGLTYKVCDWFKVGGGYTFIGHFDGSKDFCPRHRLYLEGTGMYKAGDWHFSLKEKLQLTHLSYDINPYQETRNSLSLKSRFKVEYSGIKHVHPYAMVELRNVFNDPSCSATYSDVSDVYTDYQFTGYNSAYVNRVRTGLGVEWKVNKHNALDFYCLGDWNHSKEIDTNKSGTKLRSLAWENGFRFIPGVTYCYSF